MIEFQRIGLVTRPYPPDQLLTIRIVAIRPGLKDDLMAIGKLGVGLARWPGRIGIFLEGITRSITSSILAHVSHAPGVPESIEGTTCACISQRQYTRQVKLCGCLPSRAAGQKSNLVLVCRACNLKKGVRTDEEFAKMPDDVISRL
jgi:hypothetical protein